VRAHALLELGDSESIDLFLREEDAFAALEDAVSDESDWAGLLYVAPIELDVGVRRNRHRGPEAAWGCA
jgi:hypothetical protein